MCSGPIHAFHPQSSGIEPMNPVQQHAPSPRCSLAGLREGARLTLPLLPGWWFIVGGAIAGSTAGGFVDERLNPRPSAPSRPFW
jgi:hypothetical protein